MAVCVLDREMFSEAEAARLLRVSQSTLHYWLEGGERRGRVYQPVVRIERYGYRKAVSWAEFVEAGLLRMYRRSHNVPMSELRAFIDLLRQRYEVPYPLADQRPFVADRELVVEVQNEVGLDPELCLVALVRDQPMLTPPSQSFFDRVTWDGNLASAWRPHDDPQSPVRMDPEIRFGRPAVGGVSTEVICEQLGEGADEDEVAESFHLSLADVRWAAAYETSAQTA